jgi:hypothetical protein
VKARPVRRTAGTALPEVKLQMDTYESALSVSPAATVVLKAWSPPMLVTGALLPVTVSWKDAVPHEPRKLHILAVICATPGRKYPAGTLPGGLNV